MQEMINVVVAEDNDDLRSLMPMLLDDAPGFHCVGTTAYIDEVAPLISQYAAQVAVLDIELRGGSSLALLPALRSQFPATKFIIHSGHSNPALIRNAKEMGADAYVLKSGDFDELIEVIRSLLRPA
jgi:DNA-binding NarL/FixJ family response regulator